jgi:hypothetical protein
MAHLQTLRTRLLLCLAFALMSLGSNAQTTSGTSSSPGVLLRSRQGAYALPKVIVPTAHFEDATAGEFAKYMEHIVLGNIHWTEPGMRYRVTCSDAAKNRRFSFGKEKDITALELLMEFALGSGTIVTVDDLKITIDLPK